MTHSAMAFAIARFDMLSVTAPHEPSGAMVMTVQRPSEAAHDQSLFDLNAKYADVVSLDETLQYMKTVGHNRAARR